MLVGARSRSYPPKGYFTAGTEGSRSPGPRGAEERRADPRRGSIGRPLSPNGDRKDPAVGFARGGEKRLVTFVTNGKLASVYTQSPTFVKAFWRLKVYCPHFRPIWTRNDWKNFQGRRQKGYKTVTGKGEKGRRQDGAVYFQGKGYGNSGGVRPPKAGYRPRGFTPSRPWSHRRSLRPTTRNSSHRAHRVRR